jgi:hypothetical protein
MNSALYDTIIVQGEQITDSCYVIVHNMPYASEMHLASYVSHHLDAVGCAYSEPRHWQALLPHSRGSMKTPKQHWQLIDPMRA